MESEKKIGPTMQALGFILVGAGVGLFIGHLWGGFEKEAFIQRAINEGAGWSVLLPLDPAFIPIWPLVTTGVVVMTGAVLNWIGTIIEEGYSITISTNKKGDDPPETIDD